MLLDSDIDYGVYSDVFDIDYSLDYNFDFEVLDIVDNWLIRKNPINFVIYLKTYCLMRSIENFRIDFAVGMENSQNCSYFQNLGIERMD